MPLSGVSLLPRERILTFEEILGVVREAAAIGVRKIRLTGGEPLVRKGLPELIRMIASVEGIRDLAMSTNGVLLAEQAGALRDAGLMRVNVSLDAVEPGRYREITRGGELARVLAGIDAALEAGLSPVKLNCVVERSSDEPDARGVADFAQRRGLEIRFIRRMNVASADFSVVDGGSGGDCERCSRLRLSADGMVRPCLFDDAEFSVRKLGPREALLRAVEAKPAAGRTGRHSGLYAIGG